LSVHVSHIIPINACILYINIVIQCMLYAIKMHNVSHDCQPFHKSATIYSIFVMPEYVTHSKLWCDKSSLHKSKIYFAKISFLGKHKKILISVIHLTLECMQTNLIQKTPSDTQMSG